MKTYVNICFEMPDESECDKMYEYLEKHPIDIWNYEERVRQNFHARGFNANFHAHWSSKDILSTRVTRLNLKGSNIIQYEVTLTQDATDPRILVDILRRCSNTQEGNVGSAWTIHAWYRREGEDAWIEDAGNNGQVTRYTVEVHTLLCQMKEMMSE